MYAEQQSILCSSPRTTQHLVGKKGPQIGQLEHTRQHEQTAGQEQGCPRHQRKRGQEYVIVFMLGNTHILIQRFVNDGGDFGQYRCREQVYGWIKCGHVREIDKVHRTRRDDPQSGHFRHDPQHTPRPVRSRNGGPHGEAKYDVKE